MNNPNYQNDPQDRGPDNTLDFPNDSRKGPEPGTAQNPNLPDSGAGQERPGQQERQDKDELGKVDNPQPSGSDLTKNYIGDEKTAMIPPESSNYARNQQDAPLGGDGMGTGDMNAPLVGDEMEPGPTDQPTRGLGQGEGLFNNPNR